MAEESSEVRKAVARRQELLAGLASSPLVEITGVVGPLGPGGSKWGKEELWMLRFVMEAWRVSGGELLTNSLTLIRRVGNDELKRFQSEIKPYTVLRIRGRLADHPDLGTPQALLEEVVPSEHSDPELELFSKKLQEPVIINDSVFGILTLDRRVKSYQAKVLWNAIPVTVHVSANTEDQFADALQTGYQLWQNQSRWDQRVKDYAVLSLLPLKNESWLSEDQPELSEQEFVSKMKLVEISLDPEGGFTFWHNDGDLFWGHSIMIAGSLKDGPTDADIPG